MKAGYRLANFIKDVYKDSNIAESQAERPKLQEPYRDHSFAFLNKAKSIVKKLFHIKSVLHPDCDS